MVIEMDELFAEIKAERKPVGIPHKSALQLEEERIVELIREARVNGQTYISILPNVHKETINKIKKYFSVLTMVERTGIFRTKRIVEYVIIW